MVVIGSSFTSPIYGRGGASAAKRRRGQVEGAHLPSPSPRVARVHLSHKWERRRDSSATFSHPA